MLLIAAALSLGSLLFGVLAPAGWLPRSTGQQHNNGGTAASVVAAAVADVFAAAVVVAAAPVVSDAVAGISSSQETAIPQPA